jgi:capsular exopolysaccharide synthesis family protein
LSYNLGVGLRKNAKEGHVVFCTSTIKGEGKTHVSLNLTLALSSMSKKVLLIGADLRNPQVHNFIERQKNEIGLSNYLFDEELDWRTALIKNFEQHPHLAILLSGEIPPNPTLLLTNGRLDTLLEEAKLEYDYIVVDTAPTLLVSDTLLISTLADSTVYVTRYNYTEKKLLEYSKELAENAKLNNLMYVVNSMDVRKSNSYGYGYGYRYGYGYGYGYTKDKEKVIK